MGKPTDITRIIFDRIVKPTSFEANLYNVEYKDGSKFIFLYDEKKPEEYFHKIIQLTANLKEKVSNVFLGYLHGEETFQIDGNYSELSDYLDSISALEGVTFPFNAVGYVKYTSKGVQDLVSLVKIIQDNQSLLIPHKVEPLKNPNSEWRFYLEIRPKENSSDTLLP